MNKDWEALSMHWEAKARQLEAQLADLRELAYERAPKLAAEECDKQKAQLEAQLREAEERIKTLEAANTAWKHYHDQRAEKAEAETPHNTSQPSYP